MSQGEHLHLFWKCRVAFAYCPYHRSMKFLDQWSVSVVKILLLHLYSLLHVIFLPCIRLRRLLKCWCIQVNKSMEIPSQQSVQKLAKMLKPCSVFCVIRKIEVLLSFWNIIINFPDLQVCVYQFGIFVWFNYILFLQYAETLMVFTNFDLGVLSSDSTFSRFLFLFRIWWFARKGWTLQTTLYIRNIQKKHIYWLDVD